MISSDAGREAMRELRRVGWLLHASVVETKLHALRDAVKYGFDPNQPRVLAGNPDGGEWTGGGGGTGGRLPSGSLGDGDTSLTQIAQNAPRRGPGSGYVTLRNGTRAPATLRQEATLQGLRLEANRVTRQIRERDPNWRPTPSLTETAVGEILATRAEIREAEAYLRDLRLREVGPGPNTRQSIPARGPERNFTESERREINRMGREDGCHSCGSKDPGTISGNFVPDHQPPNALNSGGRPQRLFPQCLPCSSIQGGTVSTLKRSRKQ